MPQFDQAARTTHYRAIRVQAWDDLRRQHDLYTKYWQESEGLGLGGAWFDESRFRGPVNLFLDELLTHSNAADARSIARSLPASWGAASEAVLYVPLELMRGFVERTLPEPQWGGRVVDLAVAADESRWKPWLSARLRTLGVGTEHVFPRSQPAATGDAPRESASPFSWSRAGTIAAVTATTIGLYAAVRWRLAKAESGKAR